MPLSTHTDLFNEVLLRPGYISVIAGEPGTGKTFLALKACIENMKKGKKSVYFSFNEDGRTIKNRIKEVFGFELGDMIEVREAITMGGEGAGLIAADLLSTIDKTSLLVLDSLDALMMGIRSEQERRTLLQSLYKSIKAKDVSLILVSESGDPYLLAGYAADAYMIVNRSYVEDRVYRYVHIKKARDVPIFCPYCTFSSYGGFRGIPHLERLRKVKVGRTLEDRHMDAFMKGTRMIIEFDTTIPYFFINEMKRIFASYFLEKGNGVMYFTSYDEDGNEVEERLAELLVDKDKLSNLIVVAREEEEIGRDLGTYWSSFYDMRKDMTMKLKEKTGNKMVISIFSLWFNDLVYSSIGEKHVSAIQRFINFDKKHGVRSFGFTSTGVRVNEVEKRLADGYFRFILKHGRIFAFGEKPSTLLYGVDVVEKDGRWGYEFIPMI